MSRSESRLENESSPYLRAQAQSPVSWQPWGAAAFQEAERLDKAVLLSIGYASCHHCQRMDREVFGNFKVASKLNDAFVCIKVDRGQRPDLDSLYRKASLAICGRGSWPMTIFLTPDAQAFFAVPFFSEAEAGGSAHYLALLEKLSQMWSGERQVLLTQAKELSQQIQASQVPEVSGSVSEDSIRAACLALSRDFDSSFGGFGRAPKVAPCAALSLLLRHHRRTGQSSLLGMVTRTLDAMMTGGIYDHLGGGFFRLAIDQKWSLPRFEKLLGDNAALASIYIEAYQVTSYAPYRRIAEETLDFLLREMRQSEGAFVSALSASSKGEEGAAYLWTRAEVQAAVEEPSASHFCEFFGVSESGNFRGKSVLSLRRSLADVAAVLRLPEETLLASLEDARVGLLHARGARPAPEVDEQVSSGDNGLVIRALASAAFIFEEPRYLEAAQQAADFVFASFGEGEGLGPALSGVLFEDYAFFAEGVLRLYELGAGDRYLKASVSLTEKMLDLFSVEEHALLASTPRSQVDPSQVYGRSFEGRDGPRGNENASACLLLARLAVHEERPQWRARAEALAQDFATSIRRDPRSYCSLLSAVDFLLSGPLVRESAAHLDQSGLIPLDSPRRELGSALLAGRASAEATAALQKKSPLGAKGYASLGKFKVSRLALGSYRIGLDLPRHRQTVKEALLAGINFIDTSPSFAMGDSERLVGQVLAELCASGEIQREQVLLLSKVGVALGSEADHLLRRGREAQAKEETPPLFCVLMGGKSEDVEGDLFGEEGAKELLSKGAFCLDPLFLKRQIEGSLQRLAVEHLDFCLIQSPEHFLRGGGSREELREALLSAFGSLEEEVAAGRIGAYGILCTTLAGEVAKEQALELSWLLEIAAERSPEGHHLRVLELPLNLVERGAVERKQADGTEGPSLVEAAVSAGLSVVTVRPLSTFVEGASLHLVNPKKSEDGGNAEGMSRARYRVASLEAEFETTFAVNLRLSGKVNQGLTLPLSGPLGKALERVRTREQFDLAEGTMVTPQLRQFLSQLDQAFAGKNQQEWQKFRKRYVEAVGAWLACLREVATDENRRILSELDQELQGETPFAKLSEERIEALSWAQRALSQVIHCEGVSATFVGLRDPARLQEALASRNPASDAKKW